MGLQALVYQPVDAGTRLEHHMYNGPFGSSLDVMAGEGLRARGPRLLSKEQLPGWKQCALTVTECQVSRDFLSYQHGLGHRLCRQSQTKESA